MPPPSERQEADALLDAYMAALGMLPEEQSSRVHVHVREEKIEKIRPETADVVAPETGAAVAGGSGQPEMIPANADGRNVEATVEQRPSATEFMNEPAAATETAGDYLREPAAVVSGQIIREGDAPQGTDHANGDAPRPDTDFQPPAFLSREAKPFRPNCLNPGDNCAGQGNQHCYSCRKAMAEADAVPA
jgi:hypothetical protein